MELFSEAEKKINQGTSTSNWQIIIISNCSVTCTSSVSYLQHPQINGFCQTQNKLTREKLGGGGLVPRLENKEK